MNTIKTLFLLFIFIPSICNSQKVTEKQILLLNTFTSVHGQENTLANITVKFPQLNSEVSNVEIEFANNYRKAISHITSEVKKIYDEKFDDYLSKLENITDTYFNSKKLTEENARLFIEKVKMRAGGMIKSPFVNSLLEYEYQDNPVDEFLTNHNNLYSVKRYTNSGKSELTVKIPKSWKELDGLSPSVVKKFRSKNGTGNAIITIIIENINNKKYRDLKINHRFTKTNLLKMAPIGSKVTTASSTKIDDKRTGIIEYEDMNPKIGSNQKRIVTQYMLLYHNNILRIDCATYGTIKDDLLDKTILKLNPLYLSIVKSIIFNDLSKSDNSLTYKIRN